MNDFIASLPKKIDKFIEILIDYNGYVKVLQGLQNTLKIAVLGLIIGIVIVTMIATVRVIPKYKVLPRILNAICAFYVALFRGTPMVVQLLIFYYVVLRSSAPTNETTDVSLIRAMNSLPRVGRMFFIACGMTMSSISS